MYQSPEAALCAGSSPRVRGKGQNALRRFAVYGIIPAGAGKSSFSHPSLSSFQDHPRGCGEKRKCEEMGIAIKGSSPRVRGKVFALRQNTLRNGIIPAGAGKSRKNRAVCGGRQDHPRGCGEKALSPRFPPPPLGSSPRVRGKVLGA